jgi:hypothetical protein
MMRAAFGYAFRVAFVVGMFVASAVGAYYAPLFP